MALPEPGEPVLLLHNPRCSKSRAVLGLLEERGVRFTERLYLEEPLTRAELTQLASRLDRPPREWIRRGEKAFAESGLEGNLSGERVLDAIAKHPILMERPIVVRGERAVVGRPPERALELLEED